MFSLCNDGHLTLLPSSAAQMHVRLIGDSDESLERSGHQVDSLGFVFQIVLNLEMLQIPVGFLVYLDYRFDHINTTSIHTPKTNREDPGLDDREYTAPGNQPQTSQKIFFDEFKIERKPPNRLDKAKWKAD
jgi:hypothetical protein